jgi:O-antigen/teichoic acid export membrane protein
MPYTLSRARGRTFSSDASWLAIAGLVEYGFQLILPIILVRALTLQEFADFRAVWLVAATAMAIAPFYLPQVLVYFLPRSKSEEAAGRIASVSVVLVVAGVLTSAVVYYLLGKMTHALPASSDQLAIVLFFLAAWVPASMLDTLAIAKGYPRLQALITVAVAATRTVLVCGAALFFDGTTPVLMGLLALSLIKLATLPFVDRNTVAWCKVNLSLVRQQILYAAPFAFANALFLLRLQIDQWIVLTKFSTTTFAAFSIAAVSVSLSNLVRQPIMNAFMPATSSLLGQGRLPDAMKLISRSYLGLAFGLGPFVGLLMVLAPELVSLVYTSRYVEAGPIMQFYLLGQIATVFGGGHLLMLVRQGAEAVRISAFALLTAATLGYAGATLIGPLGAALGSVAGLLVGEFLALRRAASALSTSVRCLINADVGLRVVMSATLATALSLWFLKLFLPTSGTVIRMLVGGVMYLVVLLLIGATVRLNDAARDLREVRSAPIDGGGDV